MRRSEILLQSVIKRTTVNDEKNVDSLTHTHEGMTPKHWMMSTHIAHFSRKQKKELP